MGPYIVEKALPNNNYLVRKIGTDKTQVLHRMRMRQFTPRQPPADVRVNPHEDKPDPEVSINHDDLYARAWEYHYEQPIFDAENDNSVSPNQPEIPIQTDLSTGKMRNTRVSPRNFSPNRRDKGRRRYVYIYGTRCGDKLGTTAKESEQAPQLQLQLAS